MHRLGPGTLSPAAVAFLLTFADRETPLWLEAGFDKQAVRDFLRFHTGAPIVQAARGRDVRRDHRRRRRTLRRLRHRHRHLSRPRRHPGDRGAVARGRPALHLARARHRRRGARRHRRARPRLLARPGPPITRSSPAASTSSSPRDPDSSRCRAASPWRPDHVCRGQGRRDRHRPFAGSRGRQAPRRPRRRRSCRWSRSTSSSASPSTA